jgi:hypothetical protein
LVVVVVVVCLRWQRRWGGGDGGGDEGTGMVMVVVRRKGTMWQCLNQRYSIWEVAGRGAGVGNMLTLFCTLKMPLWCSWLECWAINLCGLGFNSPTLHFFFSLLLILNTIQYN